MLSGFLIVFGLQVVVFSFWGDVAAAAHQWVTVSSYGYCLLIPPLTLYILWSKRAGLRDLAPDVWPWGLGVVALFAAVWGLAAVAGIAEAGQFAVVGVVQGLLATLLGRRIYRRLWLPFSLLWLLVPTGEFLVPALQSATAVGAGGLLGLSGIPIYRDGLTILVPSGSYVVAPGCSGLSFLLSALVVALTFADLFFIRRAKQILFVLATLAMAVAANALRVFLIIAVAHATGNVADIAEDHLLYGWAFFSLLLLGALAVGYRFRDDPPPQPPGMPEILGTRITLSRTVWILALALVTLVVGPLALGRTPPDAGTARAVVMPPLSCGGFTPSVRPTLWRTPAALPGVDGLTVLECERDGRAVHVVLAVLERPVRWGKLAGVERWLIDRDLWTRLEIAPATARIDGRDEPILAERIGQGGSRRLVWSLFWTGGAWRRPGLDTLLADVASDLTGRRRAVALLVGADEDAAEDAANPGGGDASALLRDFLAGSPLRARLGGSLDGGLPQTSDNAEGR